MAGLLRFNYYLIMTTVANRSVLLILFKISLDLSMS
jgi:hypothetical protein